MAKQIGKIASEVAEKIRNPNLEYPDPTPIHIPGKSDKEKPLSLREEMRRFVREELSKQAAMLQAETFEDSDDFEEDDEEPDLTSAYTVHEMSPDMGSHPDDLEGSPTQEDLAQAPVEASDLTNAEPVLPGEQPPEQ